MAVFASTDLKRWREAQGISAADLAERVSCDTTTLYRYEAGKIKMSPDVMYQICEALGDTNRWVSWMRTEYPASYGRVHPELPELTLPGVLMSIYSQIPEINSMQAAVLRDGADGRLDDPKLRAHVEDELGQLLGSIQALVNMLSDDAEKEVHKK